MEGLGIRDMPARLKMKVMIALVAVLPVGSMLFAGLVYVRTVMWIPYLSNTRTSPFFIGYGLPLLLALTYAIFSIEPFMLAARSRIRCWWLKVFPREKNQRVAFKQSVERMIQSLNHRYFFDYGDDFVWSFHRLVSEGSIRLKHPFQHVSDASPVAPCFFDEPLDLFGIPVKFLHVNAGVCIGPAMHTDMEFDEVVAIIRERLPRADENHERITKFGRSFAVGRKVKGWDEVAGGPYHCVVSVEGHGRELQSQFGSRVSFSCMLVANRPST